MPVSYGELEPSADLRPLVASYWVFRVDGPLPQGFAHSVPLDGAVSLFVSRRLGVPLVLGPRTLPLRPPVAEGDVVHGVRLWPGAAAAALRTSVTALRDQVVPLESVLPGDWSVRFLAAVADGADEEATAARLDQAWAPLAERGADLDAAVMRAVFAIVRSQGGMAVGALARESGLSERHLRRRFEAAVGLSPKELSRIRRLRASLVEALSDPQRRWVELAAACGYSDQAHLVREYRRLSGLAPQAYLAQLERIRHGRVAP